MNSELSILLGLGPNAEWPYSEKALIEVIQLQREKEVTKQLYYRAENTSRSIELFNRCVQTGIPSFLIPFVFVGEAVSEELIQKAAASEQFHDTPPASTAPYSSYRPNVPAPNMSGQQPTHLAPPATFHRNSRPLSPAKIGAAAVSHLDRGRFPSSPMHKRNSSLPVIPTHTTPPPNRLIKSPSSRPHPPTQSSQGSMMNTIGSLQFINENPGKKRRRSSGQKEEDGQVDEDGKDKENAATNSTTNGSVKQKVEEINKNAMKHSHSKFN